MSLNHLYILLNLFPDKPWNYEYLSLNPNITYDIVQKNPDKSWNYYYLSQNLFNKHPFIHKKNLMKKYSSIWLKKYKNNKTEREQYKIEYNASMDLVKLRFEDIVCRQQPNKSPKILF